jgi:hypothetical protein
MKIREHGKEHGVGNANCASCAAIEGEYHPQKCGVNSCGGLRHAEEFDNVDKGGSEVHYVCDKCGEKE